MFSKYHKLIFILFISISIIEVFCEYDYFQDIACTKKTKIQKTLEVATHAGKITGQVLINVLNLRPYSSFKGIPYAKPPIGNLRFKASIDVPKWKNVRDTIEHGNICPQMNKLMYGDKVLGNEDCLFLNVYTPVLDFNFNVKNKNPQKAVMVWIHGGAFAKGSGNSEYFGPDFLIDKDVILVTMNYRLGALGFLNLNTTNIQGNAGLKDQNLALKWVKTNIAKFGGDPNKVTIFGQSAGGVSVDLHLISDMSRGLFKRSIAMSGSLFCSWAFNARHGESSVKLFNQIINSNMPKYQKYKNNMEQLYINADVQDIVKHTKIFSISKMAIPFTPTIEEILDKKTSVFLDECFDNKFRKRSFFQGEHMLGYTGEEVCTGKAKKVQSYADLKEFSKILFNEPIDMKHNYMLHYVPNIPLYYYRFGFAGNNAEKNGGVGHSDDLKYIFYQERYNKCKTIKAKEKLNDKYSTIRDYMTTFFTDFAKHGNPSIKNSQILDIVWEASKGSKHFLSILPNGRMEMNTNRNPNCKVDNFDYYKKDLCFTEKPQLKDAILKFLKISQIMEYLRNTFTCTVQ